MPVALWSVTDEEPRRLEQRHEWVEAQLEAWIKRDPTLVAQGLRWIGQQVIFPDRCRLDLLGITQEGGLVLAELKRGMVGISTLAQALQYVLWLGSLDPDALISRLSLSGDDVEAVTEALQSEGALDVSIMLIGTSRAPELDRAADFLVASGLSIPVSIVTFTPFTDAQGEVFLARETEDHEVAAEDTSPRQRSKRGAKVEWVLDMAREHQVQDAFEVALGIAQELDLRVKPWPKSITVVPPFTHGRTLIYLRPQGTDRVRFGYSDETVAELYGAEPAMVRDALGENWTDLSASEALRRVQAFGEIMRPLLASAAVGETDPEHDTDPDAEPSADHLAASGSPNLV